MRAITCAVIFAFTVAVAPAPASADVPPQPFTAAELQVHAELEALHEDLAALQAGQMTPTTRTILIVLVIVVLIAAAASSSSSY
jgi:hypothetical protein